jgi:hypothetical protein
MRQLATALLLSVTALVAAADPIAYWRLDEVGEGHARDSAPARQHAAAPGAEACAGVVDGGLRCDGRRARLYARLPQPAASFTYEAWVRPAAAPEARAIVLARNGARDGLVLEPGGVPAFVLHGDGKEVAARAAAPLRLGAWAHLAGVYDQDARRLVLLVDGVEAAVAPMPATPRPQVMRLSAGGDGERGWLAGDLDELRVWKEALPAAEVARLRAEALAGVRAFPALQSDRSFTLESAPRELPGLVTDELRARLAALPPVRARVVAGPSGAPELQVDGRRVPLFGGQQLQPGYSWDAFHIQPYRLAGMEMLVVSLNAAFFHPESGFPLERQPGGNFWAGKGAYDPSKLETVLWRALAAHPDAVILPWIWLHNYPAFCKDHPEAAITNLRGDPMVVSSHYLRFDPKGPDPDPAKHELLAASFHSEAFVAEAEAMCAELVRAVERTVPGRRVAGWVIGGGQDAQLYDWNPPDHILVKDALLWGDFSGAARSAWGRWLGERYGSAGAVAAAWGRPVASLDPAPVPEADDLVGAAMLHHPVQGRIAVDWNRFAAEGRARLLIRLARAVKGAASREQVVAVCAGDGGARKDLAQVGELLREPAIDIHLHQPTYGQRFPGELGGLNAHLGSLSLHRKLFAADVDHPTWLVADGQSGSIGVISQTSRSRGRMADAGDMRAVWRREHAWLASQGHGAWIHPILGGPWMYRDPEVVQELGVLQRLLAGTRAEAPERPQAGVALVYDERAVAFAKGGLAHLHATWMRQQQDEALACGAPFRSYLASDVEDGLLPPMQVVVFGNCLDLTPRLAANIERLKGAGRTLVFLQGTGWVQGALGRRELVDAATGLQLVPLAQGPATGGGLAGEIPFTGLAWAPVVVNGVKGLDLLRAMPAVADEAWKPLAAPQVDGVALAGGQAGEHRALRLRGEFALAEAGPVALSLRADWWAALEVDGREVLTVDRTQGGRPGDLLHATLDLPAGRHRVEARLVSGSGGFRLQLACDRGRTPALARRQQLEADPQAGLTVADPAAQVRARYPGGQPAVAVVDHGGWKSAYVGSWLLSRHLLASLAAEAGAWCAVPPGMAVVHAGGDLVAVHALVEGPIPLTLPAPQALEDACTPGHVFPAALVHQLPLAKGETLVLRRR